MFHRMMNYGEAEARPTVLITRSLIKKFMPRYKRHDDLIIIQESVWEEFKKNMPMPVVSSENSPFSIDEDELASLVCQSITTKPPCRRVAIERGVKNDGFRTPNISLLLGENGLVTHKDNRITYQFDVTKCMFSFGNIREKMRMAELDCSNEIVVDLFAGIGYFSLPLLVHAKAKHLYACEWNPDAIEALKHNLALNKVETHRYTMIEGDNRQRRPLNVAQRVIMGILPSSMDWMKTALECVDKKTGAMLHCHDLVEAKAQQQQNGPPPPPPPPSSSGGSPASTTTSNPAATAKQLSTDSQRSDNSTSTGGDKTRSSIDNQSLVYHSLSSSSNSSHSTIEKLSVPASEESRLLQSGESSDKDTCSPVMLERPSSNSTANISSNCSSFVDPTIATNSTRSGSHDDKLSPPHVAPTSSSSSSSSSASSTTSSTASQNEDSILEPPQLADNEIGAHEARGFALVAKIKNELEACNLTARLLHIQPVKSYAPHVMHVVFDIKLEPRGDCKQINGNDGR